MPGHTYIELHARSAFSFLRGSSMPEGLVQRAAQLEMPGMALCDRDGFYGAPRFFQSEKDRKKFKPYVGVELTMEGGAVLPVLVETRQGYQNLCRLITTAQLRSEKGASRIRWDELSEHAAGVTALTGDEEGPLWGPICQRDPERADAVMQQLRNIFAPGHLFVEVQRHHQREDRRKVEALRQLAEKHRLPLLATNGVCHATPQNREALDVFTCLRHHTHLDAAGRLLSANAERHLKSGAEMQALFADLPEAVSNTVRLAERLEFTLENLGYEFPKFPVAAGETMSGVLREQTLRGARERYDGEIPEKARQQIEKELALIEKLGFAGYFLIVADLVKFCRDSNIMAQGRGSAANSTVCFCLKITAVDPLKFETLFERFLTDGQKHWPDIDIDLPSGDRREAVIQEVYRRYGQRGAAMTANVITYRGRSAAREIGKVLNLPQEMADRFSALYANGDFPETMDFQRQMELSGLDQSHPRAAAFGRLFDQIKGLPHHLGQHSGGMIICQGQLDSIVPLENASMPGRVVAQWDKDDCEDLGIVKVDLLGLGMMSVLQDSIELTVQRGHPVDLAKIPKEDPATYAMMQAADTIGVFQIESRAQMATLPRLKPKEFYDLVIEVAIIRPGPIQGNLTHPYLLRRSGKEKVDFIHPRLEDTLRRTLGVPLFQEQMLHMAMVMADFSGGEAEELRRALSYHRSDARMQKVVKKLREALEKKKVEPPVIERIVEAVGSFALYGFPESHAISFALLAYASSYLKTHYAPEFYVSLLNNQPMGFYSPATLIKDARRHGLKTRAVCVTRSDWRCTIEADDSIRLGLRYVEGLRGGHAQRLLEERQRAPFVSLEDFQRRAGLSKEEMRALAEIGALNCFAEHRREALWKVERRLLQADLFAESEAQAARGAEISPLRPMDAAERLCADYAITSLTVGPHPMALLRPRFPDVWRAADLPRGRHGQIVRIAGNVICRQRPGTAKGVVFVSLEDETGISNAIVHAPLFERMRMVITQERFLLIEGKLQTTENIFTVLAQRVSALPHEALAGTHSYDFH